MSQVLAEPHPLFLPDDEDDDIVQVSEIQICRLEGGQQVFYPRVFPAAELRSLEQVSAELGGGSYILISRHEGRITTRRKYVLPGKPKPMYDESRQEEAVKPVQTASAPALDPMMALMGGQGGFMPFLMMMMQQADKAAERQMQMIIAMMQGSQASTAEDRAAARAEMQATIERERIASERMMGLMQTAMQSKGSGSSEDFNRGVEFMRHFANQQIEILKNQAKGGGELDLGSILESFGQVMQGVNLFRGVSPENGLPSNPVPVETSPVG